MSSFSISLSNNNFQFFRNMKLIPFLNLSLLIFYLFFLKVYCNEEDDPKYVNCAPLKCGDLNISFPFFIRGQQEPYCGSPGFDLICANNNTTPILHILDNTYHVQNIFYNSSSIRVANTAVLTPGGGCLPEIKNLSLTEHKFVLPSSVSKLVLFPNCSRNNLEQHKIEFCGGGVAAENGLAMMEGNEDWNRAIKACPREVVAPVELGGGDVGRNDADHWLEVMKRGFVLDWIASDCVECSESGGRCGFDTTDLIFRCFCPDKVHRVTCRPTPTPGKKSTLKLKIGIAFGAIVAAGILVILLAFFTRRYRQTGFAGFRIKNQTESCLNVEAFLKNNGSIAPKRYSHSDIKKMTNSFTTKLGKGGFGYVYKGQLKDNTLVAVKVLNSSKGTGEEFINEIASISRTSHVNVVNLLGYCFEGSKRSLVYEFMPNGSLEKYIYNNNDKEFSPENSHKLGWETLYQIALGIARGLEYLHRGCNTPILHFDIKPHNILLDTNFHPKIADFGLAKLCLKKESHVSLVGARGTPGFIAPEVFSRSFGIVSHKSDVYSYGMMVLEMVGQRTKNINETVDHTSEMYFPHWIYKWLEFDKEFNDLLGNEEGKETVRKMIIVGLWCIQINPEERPSICRVVEMLVGNLDLLQVPPKPYWSSVPPLREDANSSSALQSLSISS